MHLYVHVPFCARRCSYCDFAIAVRREVPSRAFREAIEREWLARQADPDWEDSPTIETIYFGGGTPSRLEPRETAELLRRFRQDRSVAKHAEITLEANPDDLSPERAAAWAEAGINRVSLGAQSFAAHVLEWMHRTHSPAQIAAAVRQLRSAGIRNLSLDLIYGLPARLQRDWEADLEQVLELEPPHLSLYGLTVESGTPLGRWTARGESLPVSDEGAAGEFLAGHDRLARAGYEHYEVSNYAVTDARARHNAAYWQRKPFLGLGPSAHSGSDSRRSWNVREWEAYRQRSEAGLPVQAESERLDPGQIALERAYLGLRTQEGIPAAQIASAESTRWVEAGWAGVAAGRVFLTPEGWLRLDALVASLTHC